MKILAVLCLISTIVWGSPIDHIDWSNVKVDDIQPEFLVKPKDDVLFPSGRVVGGIDAIPHEYPYQVGMLVIKPDKMTWCGGSIISNRFILTAAHCVYQADGVRLYLGTQNYKDKEEVGQERIMVVNKQFIIHPKWDHELIINDIALILLIDEIQFNEYIQPINLPKASALETDFDNIIATASGWGQTTDADPSTSDILQYVNVKVLSQDKCRSFFRFKIEPSNICTSGAYGKNTCNGDSGGPLAIEEDDGSKTIIGLTSFGWKLGCELDYPTVFTRISYFIDWITEETGIEKRY